MAAFTHLNPEGSRFSDGTYGVFYAAKEVETAIRETVYHRERFLARTQEPPQANPDAVLRDVDREIIPRHTRWICGAARPDQLRASQLFARERRAANSNGVVYDSVRKAGGQCVAAFWPDCVGPCTQGRHYEYHWDGAAISRRDRDEGCRFLIPVPSTGTATCRSEQRQQHHTQPTMPTPRWRCADR